MQRALRRVIGHIAAGTPQQRVVLLACHRLAKTEFFWRHGGLRCEKLIVRWVEPLRNPSPHQPNAEHGRMGHFLSPNKAPSSSQCPAQSSGKIPSRTMRWNDEYGQSLTQPTRPCLTGLKWM